MNRSLARNAAEIPLAIDTRQLHGESAESCSRRQQGVTGNAAGNREQTVRFERLDREAADQRSEVSGRGDITANTVAANDFRKEFPDHLWYPTEVDAVLVMPPKAPILPVPKL